MEKLIGDVCSLIDDYFEKKVENVDWYYDIGAKFDVIDIVTSRLEKVTEEIKYCNEDIDEYMEKFEEKHQKDAKEASKAYWDDIRTQDYLEESLFN